MLTSRKFSASAITGATTAAAIDIRIDFFKSGVSSNFITTPALDPFLDCPTSYTPDRTLSRIILLYFEK
jgi:hypothetical protein